MKYGVEGWFDVWRTLDHRFVPMAEDLQNILIRELMSLKPVGEADVDKLFQEVERIRELYTWAGDDQEGGLVTNC